MKLSLPGFGYMTQEILDALKDPSAHSLLASRHQMSQPAESTQRSSVLTQNGIATSKASFVGREKSFLDYQTNRKKTTSFQGCQAVRTGLWHTSPEKKKKRQKSFLVLPLGSMASRKELPKPLTTSREDNTAFQFHSRILEASGRPAPRNSAMNRV